MAKTVVWGIYVQGDLIFASDICAISNSGIVPFKMNTRLVGEFLSYDWTSPISTFNEHVKRAQRGRTNTDGSTFLQEFSPVERSTALLFFAHALILLSLRELDEDPEVGTFTSQDDQAVNIWFLTDMITYPRGRKSRRHISQSRSSRW